MFEKRLFSLVPESVPPIVASVVFKWIALACNIGVMWILAGLLESIFANGADLARAQHAFALASPGFVALIAARTTSIYLAQRMGDKAALLAVARVRSLVYDKLCALGPAYAEVVSTAEAVQTSVEGASQLQVYFGGYLPQLFFAGLAPLTLFTLLIRQAGLAAALLLICVPVIPISIMMVMRNAKRIGAAYWSSYVDLGGMFLEAVQGLTTLKIYRADKQWHERIDAESERFRGATMRLLMMQLRSICVMDLVVYMGAALGIIVAVCQFASGTIGFGAAFLTVFLSQEFFLPMRRLGSLFHTAMNGMAASKRMFEILDTPEPKRGDACISGMGSMELVDTGYAYGDSVVLDDVNATIKHGQLVALVGESGSGKSTLAGILSGRKGNYRGSVRIDGVELRDISASSLMQAVTLVPTNGYLFAGTLRENLLLAQPGATDYELMATLERARIASFVESNGGLDLFISEGGNNLSGGQRQRICMARALLHDTPIYVFDEATSNVDAESEAAIGEVIASLAGNHTVVVVAHRLSTIADADNIMVMERGHVAETGSHTELLAKGGVYARMWESQESLAAFALTDDSMEGAADSVCDAAMTYCENREHGNTIDVSHGAAENPFADDAEGAAAGRTPSDSTFAPDDLHNAPNPDDERTSEPIGVERRSGLSTMLRMTTFVSPLFGWLLLAVVLGSAGMLAAAFVPAFGAFALMSGSDAPALGVALVPACVPCALCGIVRGPLHYAEQLCNHYIAFRLLAHVRTLVFGALRRLAPAKLEGRGKGDLISLVTSDIELLEVFYAHTISPIAIAIVCTAVMEVFLARISSELALVALAAYALMGICLPLVAARACGNAGNASRAGAGRLGAFVLDSLRGVSETIQFGGTAERSQQLRDLTSHVSAIDTHLQRRQAASEAVADALVLISCLCLFGHALGLAASGSIEVSEAFVATFAFFSSFGPVIAVSRLGASLQATLASGERVLGLLDEEPECIEVADGVDVSFTGASVEHACFSYGANGDGGTPEDASGDDASANASSAYILDDVSCTFPQGSMTCISGRSGSGKSTLLKLLMRFWDTTSGTVRIAGADVRLINTDCLRGMQAYMTQDTHLFVGTLRENLLLACADADEDQLAEACKAAALSSFIDRLPMGLDTPVSELGDSLSGGERQRIGLARVFLSDAPFILLDEPTSSLDALNEAAVMRAVAELRHRGKTIVLVSHRASTCSFVDARVSVEHGRLS